MRVTSYLGLGLLVVGVLLIVAPSGAFDLLSADRGIGVETAANEENALLGLESDYDGTEITYEERIVLQPIDDNAQVANVTNNVDNDWTDISVEVDSVTWGGGLQGNALRVADAPESLTSGETAPIELECSRQISDDPNDATVRLDISAQGNGPVSVERNSFTVTGIDFNCEGANDPGSGPTGDPDPISDMNNLAVVGTPSAEPGERFWDDPPNSVVTFSVEYTGDGSATVTGIEVQETDSTANRVEAILGNNQEVEIDTTEDGSFDANSGMDIGTSYPLDQNAVIDSGESADVTIQEFREEGELTRVGMTDHDVTVVLTIKGLDEDNPNEAIPVEIEREELE